MVSNGNVARRPGGVLSRQQIAAWVAMLLLALAPASYLLAPAPARRCTAHQSWTPRARVLLSENTEREAKAAAAAEANEALQQQYVELKMQYAGATERLRVRDEQLQDLQAGAQPISR